MLTWLKSLFSPPKPAGPPQELKTFAASTPTISQESITVEDDGWHLRGGSNQAFRLFEVPEPEVEQCLLSYRAQLKTEGLTGKAYLEMWCRLPGGGEFFSKGLNNALTGTNDWVSCEIPFYLKQGQKPDLIKLNLVIEGEGDVWIKDISLLRTPLQ